MFLLATVYVASAVALASNPLRQGIVGGSGLFGVALTNLVAPVTMSAWGWRGIYATPMALLALLVALLVAARVPVSPAGRGRLGLRDLIRPLTKRNAWALGLSHTAGFGTFSVMASWLVGYLSGAMHLTPSASNYLTSAIISMGGLARVLSGVASLGLHPKALVAVSLGIAAVALFLETLGPPLVFSALLILLALWFSAYSYSSIFALSFQADPPEELGATTGAFNFIASIAAATMPYLFGLAVDIGGNYRGGFLLVSGVALMGTVSIGLFRQYKVR
jgi:nitrate/nitrite transporter NarK